MLKHLSILCSALILITGCNESPNYSYLMKNPNFLKQAVQGCQSSGESTDYCEMVDRAGNDFRELIEKAQTNPERFGQDLLDQEIACVKSLQSSGVANSDSSACDQMKYMLAVLSLSPPE